MPTPRTDGSGRHVMLVLLGLCAVALMVLLARRSHHAPPPAPPATASAPRPTTTRAWAVPAPPPVVEIASRHEPDRGRVGLWMLEDPNLPLVAAESLINWRFPRGSQPLRPGMTDVLHPNARSDPRTPLHHQDGSDDPGVQVQLAGDKFRLFGDDAIHATLTAFRNDQPIAVNVLDARALAVEPNSHRPLGPAAPLAFSDGGDHAWATTWKATGTPLADHAGYVDLAVTYDVGDGNPAVATLDLFYQPSEQAPARFTGEVREQLSQGSLTLLVGVDVVEAGWYAVDANLFDAGGNPTAMLAARLSLPRGHVEVPLMVYGRVVREAGAIGPFKLTNLRGALMLVGQDPDRKLMADGPDFVTRAWAADDFTDEENWDAQKEARIRNLMASASGPGPALLHRTVAEAQAQGWTPHW